MEIPGINDPHLFFSPKQMQGSTTFGPCFSKNKGTAQKIEGSEMIASAERGSNLFPMKTTRNHQMQHHPSAIVELNRDLFADPAQNRTLCPSTASTGGSTVRSRKALLERTFTKAWSIMRIFNASR
jgi:hypothetical protein